MNAKTARILFGVLLGFGGGICFGSVARLAVLTLLRTGYNTYYADIGSELPGLGVFLIGCLFLSLGCFASAISRSQMAAAMISFVLGVSLFSLGFAPDTPFVVQTAYGLWMFSAVLIWDLCITRAAGYPPVVRRFMAHERKIERFTGAVLPHKSIEQRLQKVVQGAALAALSFTIDGSDGRPQMTALTATKAIFGGIGKDENGGTQGFGADIPGLGDRAVRLQRLVVAGGPAAGDRPVRAPGARIADDADRGPFFDLDADRHGERRVAVDVVRGAVEGIDHPANAARAPAQRAFLSQQGVVGAQSGQPVDDQPLRRFVDLAHDVGGRGLRLGAQGVAPAFDVHLPGVVGQVAGESEQLPQARRGSRPAAVGAGLGRSGW